MPSYFIVDNILANLCFF